MGSFTVLTSDVSVQIQQSFLLCPPCKQVYSFNEMWLENTFSESAAKPCCCLHPAYICRAFFNHPSP